MSSKPFGKRAEKSTSSNNEKAKISDWIGLGLLSGLLAAVFTTDYWMPAANEFVGFICKVIEFSDLDPEIWALRPGYSYADSLQAHTTNNTAIAYILGIAILATLILCVVAHFKTNRQIKRTMSASRRNAFGLA